ncbi:MAG: hypothetical protein ABJA71_10845, partial [Ginsengibacter sp.]
MKTSLKFAFILGFVGFVTSFGAHIVAVNLPFYAEKVRIGLTMIGVRTQKGFYVTAIDGGGRTADPIVVTSSPTAGPWEKFKLPVMNPNTPHDKSIQT